MGKTRPILQGVVSKWDDGVTEYGMNDPREGDVQIYILAHQERDYEIAREEDSDKMPMVESQFRLYDPGELSVEQHNELRSSGFHFHDITEADLLRMLRAGFDGRACRNG